MEEHADPRTSLESSSSFSSSDHTAVRARRDSGSRAGEWGRGIMLEGKAMVEDTDMPAKMQAQAMAAASRALDRFDVLDCRSIAAHIKKVPIPSPSSSLCSGRRSLQGEICAFPEEKKTCSTAGFGWAAGV